MKEIKRYRKYCNENQTIKFLIIKLKNITILKFFIIIYLYLNNNKILISSNQISSWLPSAGIYCSA